MRRRRRTEIGSSSASPVKASSPGHTERVPKPKVLKPGDTLRLVSPASPLTPEKVQPLGALLQDAGYRLTLGEHAFDADFYLAGSDQDRADDLNRAFLDPEVDA